MNECRQEDMELNGVVKIEPALGIKQGEYPGLWYGYEVTFETPYGRFIGMVRQGLRGSRDVTVCVSYGGSITVKVP